MIPAEAVEAAAKWLHDNDCRSALHSGFPADFDCYDWMDEAKELLEAAAPHIFAPVLALADEMDNVHGSIRGHVTTYQLRQALGANDE